MSGVQVGWGVLGKWEGDECSVNGRDWERLLSKLFLKTLTEGAVMTEAGSLFQYFTTLTENAGPLHRRWLATWSTL